MWRRATWKLKWAENTESLRWRKYDLWALGCFITRCCDVSNEENTLTVKLRLISFSHESVLRFILIRIPLSQQTLILRFFFFCSLSSSSTRACDDLTMKVERRRKKKVHMCHVEFSESFHYSCEHILVNQIRFRSHLASLLRRLFRSSSCVSRCRVRWIGFPFSHDCWASPRIHAKCHLTHTQYTLCQHS